MKKTILTICILLGFLFTPAIFAKGKKKLKDKKWDSESLGILQQCKKEVEENAKSTTPWLFSLYKRKKALIEIKKTAKKALKDCIFKYAYQYLVNQPDYPCMLCREYTKIYKKSLDQIDTSLEEIVNE